MNPKHSVADNKHLAPREVPFFTVATASETLVFVRRVVRDAVATYAKLMELRTAHEEAALDVQQAADAARIRDVIDQEVERLRNIINELEGVGCQFKDPVVGLVDFPALYQGRPVWLCWKLDEPEIGYWHEHNAGFAGRYPIDDAFRAAVANQDGTDSLAGLDEEAEGDE